MTVNRKPDENEEIGVVNNERSGEESASPEVGVTYNERPGEVGRDPEIGLTNNERPGEQAADPRDDEAHVELHERAEDAAARTGGFQDQHAPARLEHAVLL